MKVWQKGYEYSLRLDRLLQAYFVLLGAVLFIVLALAQSIELCLIRGQVRPIFDEVLRSQGSTNDATKSFSSQTLS